MIRGSFQLQCDYTGEVKLYGRMSKRKAHHFNAGLRLEGSRYRWVPVGRTPDHTGRARARQPLDGVIQAK